MLKGNASEIKALVYSKVNYVNLSAMYNKFINLKSHQGGAAAFAGRF